MKACRNWFLLFAGCMSIILLAGCEASSNPSSSVTVFPASVYLSASQVNLITFSASGGTSNFTWSVSNPALGTVYGANATAVYQSTTNVGINTVVVTDSASNTTSAVITQQ